MKEIKNFSVPEVPGTYQVTIDEENNSMSIQGPLQIAPLKKVQHTCTHDSIMQLAEDYRLDLLHTLKNMSAAETYQLYISWLNMRGAEHFKILNEAVNSYERRKDDL